MLNEEEILKVDRNRVYSVYEDWPKFALDIISTSSIDIDKLEPSSIILAGMGGSGTTADILYDMLYDRSNIPIYVIKGYHLPSFIDSKALMIAISSSGNTEETISAFVEAHRKGLDIIGISSGGLLEKACKNNNYKHVKIEEHLAPRYSLPDILFVTLKIVSCINGIEWLRNEIDNAISVMFEISNKISIHNDVKDNLAKQLALYINNIPVSYTSPYCKSVGIRFKNSLNENTKILSITSDIIEASHNEIVAWSNIKDFNPIFIPDPRDGEEVRNRFDIFKDIIKMYGNEYYELSLISDNILANIVGTLYTLDYATIYLSVLKGIDPLPIEPILKLKSMMKKVNYIDKLRDTGVNI